jgi:hypothetical protein
MGANAGAAALDAICPAEGSGTVCHGQAGDGELDAVDGGGGHRDAVAVVLWNCSRLGGGCQPTRAATRRSRLRIAVG